jgi:hypothetical protein
LPQLKLTDDRLHLPVTFRVTYTVDPLYPDNDASLLVDVLNPNGQPVDHAYARIPTSVVHECVSDALHECWEAYLFGEVRHVRTTLARVIKRWRREAADRPLWSEAEGGAAHRPT